MGWTSQIIIANQVIIEGAGDGLEVYNGAAALGNLIASIAAAAGTDVPGNTVVQGIASYDEATGQISQLLAGILNLFYPGDVASSSVSGFGPGELRGYSGTTGVADIGASLRIYSQNATGLGAGQAVLNVPLINVQPGTHTAVADGTPETWHTASLATGWTGTARYRLGAENRAWLDIDAIFTDNGTTHLAAGTSIFTLPAGYRPAANKSGMVASLGGSSSGAVITTNRVPSLTAGTGGSVTIGGVTTSANAQTAEIQYQGSFPLD